MQKLLNDFEELASNRAVELIDARAAGEKIVEYTGMYAPEELIYAVGAKAFPMWRGGEPEPPDACLDETVRFLNAYDRTPYGLIKLGLDPVAPEADMYAYSLTECHTYRICELVERAGFPVCKIGVPTDWTDDDDLEYYRKKVRDFVVRMEIITGKPLSEAWLREAIEKYNAIRDLLRQIDETRKADPAPISGSEFNRAMHCAMNVEPDVAIEWLEKILAKCKEGTNAPKQKRVVMIGHVIAQGDYVVLRAFENAGANVVHEIMDDGRLDYSVNVSTEGDDLFENVVRHRYRETFPNDNMQPTWDMRREALLQAVKDYAADGVVWYDLLYDEIYDMEYSCMADELGKLGIPIIRIQTSYEYTREAMGPLNTRIETFVSTLQRR